MRTLGPYTVTSGTPFPIAVGVSDNAASVLITNGSQLGLALDFGNQQTAQVEPYTVEQFDLTAIPGFIGVITCTPVNLLTLQQPPSAYAYARVYARGETIPGTYPLALPRNIGIGNSTVPTTVNTVQNDGNPAPTQVVEATPQGAITSQLVWRNDGSGLFGGGNDVVDATGKFTSMPADAIPAAAIAAGALDTDVTITAPQISGGVPATDVTGTLPAAQVGSGYPGADVTGSVTDARNLLASDGIHGLTVVWDNTNSRLDVEVDSGTSKPVALSFTYVDASGVQRVGLLVNGDGSGGLGASGATLFTWDALGNATATSFTGPLHGNADTATLATSADELDPSAATTTYASGDHQGYPKTSDSKVVRPGSTFSGTGPGTYNMGGGTGWAAPNFVGVTTTEVNSTETVGVDTIGSSTCHVNMPNSWPFVGYAVKS